MSDRPSLTELEHASPFKDRHIGTSADEQAKMLSSIGYASLADLMGDALPEGIRSGTALQLPEARSEAEALAELHELASHNRVLTQMIGLGYHDTVTPPVIRRNVLENPGWYTAYTPYQAEISQGRLEALLNFQTVIADLTGLPVAGASLLDEPTAAAEAMTVSKRGAKRGSKSAGGTYVVDSDCHPQTIEVVRTRARPLGIDVLVTDLAEGARLLPEGDFFGVLLAYPGSTGAVRDHTQVIEAAHERGALVTLAADPLALTVLRSPGDMGADIVVGSAQRFGVPLGFGGPHAGYMALRERLERQLPGRLIGVSVDEAGRSAYRMALQTREQHIRREKATSNICTSQVLLAVMASMYAVYHGPEGLRGIAQRVHRLAAVLAAGLREGDVELAHDRFFDTVTARVPGRAGEIVSSAADRGINVRLVDEDHVGISVDEVTRREHVIALWGAFGVDAGTGRVPALDEVTPDALPTELARPVDYLTHPVFHSYRSETAMMRYLRTLQDRDIALDRSMIPLGSCTMKLNAATEMEPITWPEFAGVHPFVPLDQARGYLELIHGLERDLAELTGYDAVSMQPNAGAQGEYAGLLAVRAYHDANGDAGRDVCLIPSSAHGTNAASATMAGMRVIVVACDEGGNIDLDDLRAKVDQHREKLAAIMVTYPSTHGVFEETITEVCETVHAAGGQVYVDGANVNALLGHARLGEFGADVSHLNLHKTFCIPHGGGGPGVGPIGVRAHLAPYLPNHPLCAEAGPETGVGPIAGAPWGSAGILPISWAYVRLMGPDGMRHATESAVLHANYVAGRLAHHYPILYTGRHGLVAHECIVDVRQVVKGTDVGAEDIAKRLIDYGFHAPTMAFPVAGTLMVEPTESEDLAELDRFCDAMIAIRREIVRVAAGELDAQDNPLQQAPHTAEMIGADDWDHAYSREEAAYPVPSLRSGKYWPPVRRVQNAYGDRHLVCTCPPPTAYEG